MSKVDILIVKDTKILRDSLSKYLSIMWNYSNDTVDDGQFALDYLLEKSNEGNLPRLIITDQEMPRLYGIPLIEKVRELYHGLPSILTTGNPNYKEELESKNIPYLIKAYEYPELKEAIEKYILPK